MVFGALALLDAQQHACGIDIGDLKGHGFGDAQARSVAGHQGGAVSQAGDAGEEVLDLFGTENQWQPLRAMHTWKGGRAPGRLQRLLI
jgi:hypothetical protein